jgi:hypothetical protein
MPIADEKSEAIIRLKISLLVGTGFTVFMGGIFFYMATAYSSFKISDLQGYQDMRMALIIVGIAELFSIGYGCPYWGKKVGTPAAKVVFNVCKEIFTSIGWTIFGAVIALCAGMIGVIYAFLFPTFFLGAFTGIYFFFNDLQLVFTGKKFSLISIIIQVAVYIVPFVFVFYVYM